ncbi:phosphatase domain-containing protein [Tsukamurella soli]|uniref:Polynucleotide kinase PNKP phosphatase domain-containing protein n=1 Tax=Tsukamurella soli TaxID=644556 RepID=A0ABP8JJ50_9ACTN
MTDALIVDVDGTLVDVSSIRHHVAKRPKDFDAFHRESADCPPNMPVIHLCDAWALRDMEIVVVTARMYRWEAVTTAWLRHWMPCDFHGPFMRGDTDYRPDVEVKRDIHRILTEELDFDIVAAVDDHPKICELWESLGIPTIRIPGWEDEVA